jgi:hypothetical protein
VHIVLRCAGTIRRQIYLIALNRICTVELEALHHCISMTYRTPKWQGTSKNDMKILPLDCTSKFESCEMATCESVTKAAALMLTSDPITTFFMSTEPDCPTLMSRPPTLTG